MSTSSAQLAADIAQLHVDAGLMHSVIHGDATVVVPTEGGPVRSVANAINSITQFNYRGAWATATAYAAKDLFSSGGTVYLTLVGHTSTTVSADLAAGKIGVYQGSTSDQIVVADATLTAFVQNRLPRVVDSFATLRGLSKVIYTRALVDGSANSGFGLYWCDLSDSSTADDGWKTIVAADGGRWKRSEGAFFDVTRLGVTPGVAASQSSAIAAAQAVCALAGKIPYFPAGTYSGSVALRSSNTGIVGEGSGVTTLKLPQTTYAISSFSMASQVATVTTSAASGVFVGQGISIKGTSVSAYNVGYIVTAVLSSTQFQCQCLNYTFTNGSATGGTVSEANVCDIGQLAYGNSGAAVSNVIVRGFTFDGNRSNRATPPDDLTDWGVALTNASKCHISDVKGVHCWQGGLGAFINSNYGYIQAYVEDCGFSAQAPAGFDINSSSYNEFHCVSNACNYGARVIDNCYGNVGSFAIYNATVIGFVYGNQPVNQSYGNNFRATVIGGCSASGVAVTAKCYSSQLDFSVQGVTGSGVHEVEGNGASSSEGNTYRVSTKGCGAQSVIIGGNSGKWSINGWQDGQGGGVGSYFAIDVYGNRNQVEAVLEDSATPKLRGIAFRSGAIGNDIIKFTHNALVQEFSDSSGGVNFFEETGWTTPAFGSGWGNTYGSPYNAIGFKKCGRSVRLKGSVSGGSGTICTLPSGYYPASGKYVFPTVANGGVATVSVDTSGNVALMSGAATAVNLDHISFPIDG